VIAEPLRYLAMGDSYTIGTGASVERNGWPTLVARRLSKATGRPVALTNQAVNGFSARDLIAAELHLVRERSPQFVTVLVGANDLVQGRPEAAYRSDLQVIYDEVSVLGLPSPHVTCVSVPDFSLTAWARAYGDPAALRAGIDRVNSIALEEASARGYGWVDLTEVSRSGAGRPGWYAGDGLHPSDAQYAAWGEAIWAGVGAAWTAGVPT